VLAFRSVSIDDLHTVAPRGRVKIPEEERWEKFGGEGKKLGNEEDEEDRVVHAREADGMRRRTTGR